MNNIPDKIYLQVDADGERPEDFKECNEVSWCSDRVHKTDIAFYSEKERDEFALGFIRWGVAAIITGDKRSYKDLLSEYKLMFKRKDPIIGVGIPEGGNDY